MPAVANEPVDDIASWAKPRKLAALLLMLDEESAATVLKRLDPAALEAVCAEMASVSAVSRGAQESLMKEFTDVALEGVTSVCGGVGQLGSLLERSVGLLRASEMLNRLAPVQTPSGAMQQIAELDSRHVFNLLQHEKPQTIAVLVSHLSPEKSAQVLAFFQPEVRERVVERVATLEPVPVEILEDVVRSVQQKASSNRSRGMKQTGGTKVAAYLLNAMPKTVSSSILTAISERNPELGESVRQKMFTFEELGRLDQRSLQKILQAIEMSSLVISLKSASESLKEAILGAMSTRAAENVREELDVLPPLKRKDIETAQREIVEIVKRLEADGEIDLGDLRGSNQ